MDELILLLNGELLVLLIFFQIKEFLVEILLQLENNLLDQLNLVPLPDVGEQLVRLIKEVPNLGVFI